MDEKYNGMDNESHILFVLKEIRQLLYTEGNLKEIGLDFPILFMHNLESLKHLKSIFYKENKHYMGFCDVEYKDWSISETNSNMQISRNYKVGRIVIRIYHPDDNDINDNNEKRLISMGNIISVYLHELAHSITIGVCIKNDSKWIELEHPNEFYINYKRILQIAEKLNIFTLGKAKDKYSMRNLQRFDDIDSTFMELPKHCSIKYKHLKMENENNNDIIWDDSCDIDKIRLTVIYQKQHKLIIIKKSEWNANNNKICEFNGLMKRIYSKIPDLKKKKKCKKNGNNALNLKLFSNINNEEIHIINDENWRECIKNALNGDSTVQIKIER